MPETGTGGVWQRVDRPLQTYRHERADCRDGRMALVQDICSNGIVLEWKWKESEREDSEVLGGRERTVRRKRLGKPGLSDG